MRDRFDFDAEFKFAGDAADGTFSGYGAVFGNVDAYGDVIEKGAFKETLRDWKGKKKLPPMLEQHGGWGMTSKDYTPIGLWTSMAEDDVGLKVEGKLAIETSRGKDIYALMKMTPRPAIDGLSITYIPKSFELGTKPDEPRRKLKKVELLELGIVTFPANDRALIEDVKSGAGDITERDLERLLTRDAGLSRSEAQVVINQGFKSLKAMRDAGGELQQLADALTRNIAILKT
jgi:HK97 family phage prohead protease